ncbi:MAG: 3-hydroxyacyl-ACP dehydratase FabZ [Myxococcales bacterium]|nr:3-hydroxyacyl-ACP dehydratase FabZ [Myxococcales bacterium]MCB9523079.1 3-hydroxyacyl-ACP dehydratase FabZ [Myxococcales bacterium]
MSPSLPPPDAVLPHRPPFLYLDRVIEADLDAGRCVAERTFPPEEPFFAGHFPGAPIVPGVILVEAMAQTLAYLALRQHPGQAVLLTGVDGCKLRKPVRPGETVRFTITVERARLGVVQARAEAAVGGAKVAQAQLKGWIGPLPA